MGIYERAVFYHFIRAIRLLVMCILARMNSLSYATTTLVRALLLTGVALFSGSLYLPAMTGAWWLGVITPLGGLCFIAAWLVLAIVLARA